MRFILKSAFWLGLVAFLLPSHQGDTAAGGTSVSMVGALVGAQQAIADLTGFCDRAPQACDSGKQLATFAGERIGDGIALAYQLVQDRMATPSAAPGAPVVAEAAGATAPKPATLMATKERPTDPIVTGTVPGFQPAAISPAEASIRVHGVPPIPTPAPRA